MFKKVLVANRGEIACRVIKTCKRLGVETIAVYSEADKNCLHVKYADEAYMIGPPEPEESYLNIEEILRVAETSGVEAIHPGYGFLAERADFVEACEARGIKFIGPTSNAMKLFGNKAKAREVVMKAGVKVIPGSNTPIRSIEEAIKKARNLGFPVLVKAVYGGGGRGMRIARSEEELPRTIKLAGMEAKSAFGRPEIYLEKYIERPRHVEFQILADEHENVIHLGERECSIQRRYQKLLEECPSPALNNELRKAMGEAAIKAAKAGKYTNAGTIEFLLDENGNFYFLEVNKRIQVEHLITELVTGIDLVEEQLRIAAGEKLRFKQNEVKMQGCAINCRINCEDPYRDFLPITGEISEHIPPSHTDVRVDTHLYKGYRIPIYYDSLLAKVAVWGKNRGEAIEKMKVALRDYIIEGVPTTIPFHLEVLEDDAFIKGNYNTHFIERREQLKEIAAISSAIALYLPVHKIKIAMPRRRIKGANFWVIKGRRDLMRRIEHMDWTWSRITW